MDLFIKLLNSAGFKVDFEKGQIIDSKTNEVGVLSNNNTIYSFSDGRQIIFDVVSGKGIIHVSNNLEIYLSIDTFFQDSCNARISIYMNLNSGKSCDLTYSLMQVGNCSEYEVTFNHDDFSDEYSILFANYTNAKDDITYSYEDGFVEYTGFLPDSKRNIEGISDKVKYKYLTPLIHDSGLISKSDAKEVGKILEDTNAIIGDTVNELIKSFLSFYDNNRQIVPFKKIRRI